jgi:phosphatidate cytidylyltransferase
VIQRLTAAAIGLAIVVPAVVFGGELAVEILVPLAMGICLFEYAAMAFPEARAGAMLAIGMAIAAIYVPLLHLPWLGMAIPAAAVLLAAMITATLFPGADLSRAADRLGRALIGIAWILLLAFLVLIRRLDGGLAWVFLVLAISWCGDTGGYFAGRFLGRTPLYPRISPKKTWEGVGGAITLSVVGVFAVRALGLPQLPAGPAVALGVVSCALGILGDLAESMLKRAFQVKDSGVLLPGHGGILDRIDSVMFVAPAVFVVAASLQGTGG